MASGAIGISRPRRLHWFLAGTLVLAPVALPAQLGAPASGGTGVGSQFELTFWQSVAASEDRAQIQAYLDQYPNGTFSALARAKISTIDRREALARGTPPAPVQPVPVQPAPAPVAVPPASTPAPAPAPAPPPAAPSGVVTPPAAMPPAGIVVSPAQSVPAPMPTDAGSLADQLRMMGQSQGARRASAETVSASAVTARPEFAPVPAIVLPAQFCSAVERNGFYDERYTPARDVAESNNRAAIAYLNGLRQRYDDLAKIDDREAMNAIAAEAKAYEEIARGAYEKSAAYEGLFNQLMAVPIRKCS